MFGRLYFIKKNTKWQLCAYTTSDANSLGSLGEFKTSSVMLCNFGLISHMQFLDSPKLPLVFASDYVRTYAIFLFLNGKVEKVSRTLFPLMNHSCQD